VNSSASSPATAHATSRDTIVSVRGVVKDYRLGEATVHVLRGVDLYVARGEILAVMGPSGSGKSTLLNLVGGLDTPSGGEIEVMGERLAEMDPERMAEYRRRQVGFVFQSFDLIPSLTAARNVELPLVFAGVGRAERATLSSAALDRVGLAHRAGHTPSEMSGGEQQRVAIARALINGPAVILADEPTGNLDSHTGGEVLSLIRELNESAGHTFVITTHDPRVADRAHRVVTVIDGMVSDSTSNGGPT
jgi:putative ABC transport system ATP-binding protein